MKLKTLKNIKIFEIRQDLEQEGIEYPLIDKNDLKQEVIKWLKGLSKAQKDYPLSANNDCDKFIDSFDGTNLAVCINGIDWIKHFFNITEEDLK